MFFRLEGSRLRLGRTVLLSLAVGVLAGLAARGMEAGIDYLFPRLIGRVVDPSQPGGIGFDPRVLLMPALGGLLCGVAITSLCRPTTAHGTSVLIDAFHNHGGVLRLRDALLKAALAVLMISLGGSVGKEAAIAVLAAAIGSALAGLLGLSPRERRIFLVAGCAAGVGAIFQCPLGGAVFAATVLYRELDIEADALLPSIIASVVSYSTFMAFGGYGHFLLAGTQGLRFHSAAELPAYALLGVACALTAALFLATVKAASRFHERRLVPEWASTALAGLACGAIALVVPQVMDDQYAFLQNAIGKSWFADEPNWAAWGVVFLVVVVAKCAATGALVGTQSAGGEFGPVLFIGGAVGATVGAFLEASFPGAFPEPLREALIPVGMAGMLAASMRVPLAAVVMVMEMTGSYGLIVPLMLTAVVAYALGRRWGVYPEQVAGIEQSPAHVGEAVVGLLQAGTVREAMERPWPYTVEPQTPLPEIVSRMPAGTRPTFAVLREGRLVGLISTGDLARSTEWFGGHQSVIAADIMTAYPKAVDPEDDLYRALDLMRTDNLTLLPVVDRETGGLLGMLARGGILSRLKGRLAQQRTQMLREHLAISALDQEQQLEHLLAGLPAPRKGDVDRRPVPSDAVGRSLKESGFRARYGEVIAVQTADGHILAPPDPDRPLRADDVLVMIPRDQSATNRPST